MRFLYAAAAFAAMIVGFPATAQVPPHGTEVVDTRHSVTIHGKRMAYTAHTGLLPLYVDQTGELMGNIFIIAYIADRPAGAPRGPAGMGRPGLRLLPPHRFAHRHASTRADH